MTAEVQHPGAKRRAAYIIPVTVGTIDGGRIEGRITPFNPNLPNIVVQEGRDVAKGQGHERPKQYLEAEKIAFIAFYKEDGAPPARMMLADPTNLRVHVSGGEYFEVCAAASKLDHMLGFYAFPLDTESDCDYFYFYASGVNAKESIDLLGKMLVEDGALPEIELEKGLARQAEDRKLPIDELLVQQLPDEESESEKEGDGDEEDEEGEELEDKMLTMRRHMRIGEVLMEQGLISEEELEQALARQKEAKGKRIGEVLVEMALIQERALFRTLARKFHMAFIDLDEVNINPSANNQIAPELMRQYNVLPLDVTETCLTVAIPDPLNTEAHDVLRFQSKLRIKEVLAMPSQLARYVEEALDSGDEEEEGEIHEILKHLEAEISEEREAAAEEQVEVVEDNETPGAIVRLVDQIIIDAYKRGVSDIHIEPNGPERNVLVRFRVDGECLAYQAIPSEARNGISTRIKILAGLDIAERRLPQDGKIKMMIDKKKVELRVATIPTANQNEDVVMRILAASEPFPLDKMGFNERNLTELQSASARPYGLILCVGPTGSGKTTTLHSALGYINTIERKIWTAEDPVEITQAGLRQVQVQPRIGFTFASAMRAFLRADPDVIMIGEMRDHETSAIAVEASLTGHLVFSTLHTNSAPETVTRLLDMGLDPFSFADALLVVLAQRLARRLCKECRKPYVATQEEFDEIVEKYGEDALKRRQGIVKASDMQLWRADGCRTCGGTGYKGRLGLHELLTSSEELKHAIHTKAPAEKIRDVAIESGMTTLMQDGIDKCIDGKTDFSRVMAVCSV